MSIEIDNAFKKTKEEFEKALTHLQNELVKVRTGKASPAILNGLMVDYYGSPTPLSQVANISTADTRTLIIQPWEKKIISGIEQAIFAANLGLTPQNDGEMIRLTIPPLTEERRKELVKQSKHLGEEARIGLRNNRHKVLEVIKKEQKNGYPEDLAKRKETEIQALLTEYSGKIDKTIDAKEKDIMTI